MMMSFICSYKNKNGAEFRTYLEEGTSRKGSLEGLSTLSPMIWKSRMVLATPGPLFTPRKKGLVEE
jgi:hypothetical protein